MFKIWKPTRVNYFNFIATATSFPLYSFISTLSSSDTGVSGFLGSVAKPYQKMQPSFWKAVKKFLCMSFNLGSNVKHWWSKLASFPGLCRFRLHEECFYILQVTKTLAGPGDEARCLKFIHIVSHLFLVLYHKRLTQWPHKLSGNFFWSVATGVIVKSIKLLKTMRSG